MRITKLFIYGFGQHQNETIELQNDLTVFYGLNEAGKTTIHEFILQMLFGFPQKNHTLRSYEPKTGGVYGGKIEIEDEEFGRCFVERVGGKAGGQVQMQMADGTTAGEDGLKRLLRGYVRSDMEAVFAFSMHQLQNLDKLNEQDLNRTLFASGTTGAESLTKIEQKMSKEAANLYKKTGQNPQINKRVKTLQQEDSKRKELQQQLAQYEPKKAQLVDVERRLQNIEQQQNEAEVERKQIDGYLQVEPLLKEQQLLKEREQQLQPIVFPSKGQQRYDKNALRLEQFEDEIQTLESKVAQLQQQMEDVISTRDLEQLQQWLAQDEEWRSWRLKREQLAEQQQQLEMTIEMQRQLIGLERSATKVNSSLINEAAFNELTTRLEELQQQIAYYRRNVEEDLKTLEQARLTSGAKRTEKRARKAQKNPLILPILIVIIGLVLGLLAKQWYIPLFGIIIAGLLYINNKKDQAANDHIVNEDELEAKVHGNKQKQTALEQQLNAQRQQLQQYFKELGVTISLDEKMYAQLFQAIRTLQQQVVEQQQKDRLLDELQSKIAERYEVGCQLLGSNYAEADLSVQLQNKMQTMSLLMKKNELYVEELEDSKQRLQLLESQKQSCLEESTALFTAANVSDEAGFYSTAILFEEKNSVANRLQQIALQLNQEPYERAYTPLDLERLVEQEQQLKEVHQTLIKERAQLTAELQHLVSDDRYSIALQQFEQEKSELLAETESWIKLKIIEKTIQKTLDQLKEKTLPAVLNLATHYFNFLTNDRYARLAIDDEGFFVLTNDEQRFMIGELSQATREQAYLSLRLALASEKTKEAPFPLIMDDPFVHFDTLRTAKVVQLLRKLQKEHQILFFTCQERMKTDFEDANIIEVTSNRSA